MTRHPLNSPGSQAAQWLDLVGRVFATVDVVSPVHRGMVSIQTAGSPWTYRVPVKELRPIGPVAKMLCEAA